MIVLSLIFLHLSKPVKLDDGKCASNLDEGNFILLRIVLEAQLEESIRLGVNDESTLRDDGKGLALEVSDVAAEILAVPSVRGEKTVLVDRKNDPEGRDEDGVDKLVVEEEFDLEVACVPPPPHKVD